MPLNAAVATRPHHAGQPFKPVFSPYQLGPIELPNRLVMAPMTRSRAVERNVPNALAATYYAQRASAGLIVTEATQVSPQGVGYIRTPGIHSAEQVAGWSRITEAVHRAGGRIFLQLWHVGRISHPDFHGGELPVAPSAIAAHGQVFTAKGPQQMVTPRALAIAELPGIVEQFRMGAENAKRAGFDGVELHGANGYLLDQFTRDGSNKRTDGYGGAVENRARLPLEVTKAVIDIWGADRVGYRVSPNGTFNSMSDSDPVRTFSYLTEQLNKLGIVYLHVVDPMADGAKRVSPLLRRQFDRSYMVNGGFDLDSANAVIRGDEADLVAFGTPFLANPDLPERYRIAAPLNVPDQPTFYAGEDKGFTDYPALA
ncbi:MAG TPA: alkene reductase [Xanthobacteraceae bacterium]